MDKLITEERIQEIETHQPLGIQGLGILRQQKEELVAALWLEREDRDYWKEQYTVMDEKLTDAVVENAEFSGKLATRLARTHQALKNCQRYDVYGVTTRNMNVHENEVPRKGGKWMLSSDILEIMRDLL